MSIRIQEKDINTLVVNYYREKGYTVINEVKCPAGIVDVLVFDPFNRGGSRLIEIKELRSIKHALGQVLSYKPFYKDVSKFEVIYFTRNGRYSKYVDHNYHLNEYGISVSYIFDLVSMDKYYELVGGNKECQIIMI